MGATFIQIGEPATDEGLGLVVAARDVGSDAPAHLLFRVRRDGAGRVELRRGFETVRVLRPWSPHEAVVAMTGRGGRNDLRVVIGRDRTTFVVNDTDVGTLPRGEIGGVDGVGGLFVGRGHDVHVDGFRVEPVSGSDGHG